MSNPPIRLLIFAVACAIFIYFAVHRISHTAGGAVASAPLLDAKPLATLAATVPTTAPDGFVWHAMTHSLGACQPHLRGRPNFMPQIDVSQLSTPQDAHIKLSLSVDEYGAVTDESITAANFGLPSEQEALLNYARNLTFSIPSLGECRGRHMEILGDVFEQRNRLGHWTTLVRLYPRYALDVAGKLVTRE